jgi:signal peptidase
MKQSYLKRTRELKIREQKDDKPYTWIVTSLISILIIWFAVGVFPLFPTVILTGSMKPFLNPGDLAIMQKTRGDNMEIGDVIQYWTGEYFVIHRIVNIDNNERKYQTKGDNNSVPDSKLVGTEQIRGKLIAVVPKVGILTILLRSPGQEREIEAEF